MEALKNTLTKTSHVNSSEVFVENVIVPIAQWQAEGLKTALLTLVNVEGSSPRPVGSQIAINERGESLGLISGGCVEPALILEGLKCIQHRQNRLIRYGKDSDYFDVQLPCGSGIDIFILAIEPHELWPRTIAQKLSNREGCTWVLNTEDCSINLQETSTNFPLQNNKQYSRADLAQSTFEISKTLLPKHRVVTVGKGAVFDYFLQLISVFDYEVLAYSSVFKHNHIFGKIEQIPLPSPQAFNPQSLDSCSSLVLLSHAHEWEIPILIDSLTYKPKNISALGSRKTHAKRMRDLQTALEDHGWGANSLPEINGPAGLDLGAKSPPEIALAILSEIVKQQNQDRSEKLFNLTLKTT